MRGTRRVFWNTATLLTADVIRLLAVLVLTVAIARRLGSADLGRYTYMTTLVGILGVVADLGLSTFYIRQSQLEPNTALSGAFISLRTALGVMLGLGLASYAYLLKADRDLRVLLYLGSLLLVLGIFPAVVNAALRAKELMAYESAAKILGASLSTGSGIAAIWVGWGIIGVAAAVAAAGFTMLGVYAVLARRFLPLPPLLRQPVGAHTTILRGAWPFASLAILSVIYFRIDSLMLFAFRGQAALGQYGAAYRLMEAALLIPLTLGGAALPAVSRALYVDVDGVVAASTRAIRFLAILSIPAGIFGALFAPRIFLAVYGPDYREAARIFQVLVFTLIPVFASAVTSSLISASRKPVVNTYIAGVMVVLNVGLNLLAIPRWSGLGAAGTTVITEASGLIMGTLYIQRRIAHLHYAGELVKPAIAALIVGMIGVRYPSLVALPIYGAMYLAALWFMRALRRDDLEYVRQLLMQPRAALLPGEDL